MNVIGIVVEYNPFHNGHIYQIKKIKEMYPDSIIAVVMSTSFTMRGEISLLDKWQKTEIALKHGIDIVIELPFVYSVQSADNFAKGALRLLNEIGIDTLVFGTETDDIKYLAEIANVQINNIEFESLVKNYMKDKYNYPTSLSKAIKDLTNKEVKNPNDILAVCYLKEIIKNNYNINPISIKRTNDFNDIISDSEIVSASNVRNKYLNNIDFKNTVPSLTYDYLMQNNFDFDIYFKIIKYKIITSKNDLNNYLLMDNSLVSRIYVSAIKSENIEDLISKIKTKKYTYNRINRILLNIFLDVKKDITYEGINYIRLLGLSKKGQEYIKKQKKKTNMDIITKFSKKYKFLELEYKITSLYSIVNKNKNLEINEFKKHTILH